MCPEDTIITTNWDALLDFEIYKHNFLPDYGASGIRLFKDNGDEIRETNPAQSIPILKLHGSLNWVACVLCGLHYANLEKVIVPTNIPKPDPKMKFRNCELCGTETEGVIETPTLIKSYGNHVLRMVWKTAMQKLIVADEWYFCGYSMPPDDAWIYGLMLRALTGHAAKPTTCFNKQKLKVVSYVYDKQTDVAQRYRQAFMLAGKRLEIKFGGFQELIRDLG